jgi:putative Ca2+/H+ antiporter (TMEM165/GDT1 family)
VGVAALTFGIIFLAEVVDTSGLVTLVLGTRFPARWVLLDVCAAMAVHVALAIAAGTSWRCCPNGRSKASSRVFRRRRREVAARGRQR